jgi:hypothetical protein
VCGRGCVVDRHAHTLPRSHNMPKKTPKHTNTHPCCTRQKLTSNPFLS